MPTGSGLLRVIPRDAALACLLHPFITLSFSYTCFHGLSTEGRFEKPVLLEKIFFLIFHPVAERSTKKGRAGPGVGGGSASCRRAKLPPPSA